jgi:hypothetical protein
MKPSRSSRDVGTCCVAAAMLAGCGGSQPPIGASDAPQSRAISAGAQRGGSPGARGLGYKVTAPLLYVTNIDPNYPRVSIYRAKAKDPAPLATITNGVNIPFGACLDGNGTLYVTNEPASGPG